MMIMIFLLVFRLHEEELIELWIPSFCSEAFPTSAVCEYIFTWEYPFSIRMGDICLIEYLTILVRYHTGYITSIDREWDFAYGITLDDRELSSFAASIYENAWYSRDSVILPSCESVFIEVYHRRCYNRMRYSQFPSVFRIIVYPEFERGVGISGSIFFSRSSSPFCISGYSRVAWVIYSR